VRYSLSEPQGNGNRFELDETSGVLSLKQQLDYEVKSQFKMIITASDGRYYSLSNRLTSGVIESTF